MKTSTYLFIILIMTGNLSFKISNKSDAWANTACNQVLTGDAIRDGGWENPVSPIPENKNKKGMTKKDLMKYTTIKYYLYPISEYSENKYITKQDVLKVQVLYTRL